MLYNPTAKAKHNHLNENQKKQANALRIQLKMKYLLSDNTIKTDKAENKGKRRTKAIVKTV